MNEKLKKTRLKLNFSIYDVAKKTGLSPGYISNLENSHKDNPSKEVMEKLAKALETTVQELFFS